MPNPKGGIQVMAPQIAVDSPLRELENVVERALILCRGKPLTFDQVLPRLTHAPLGAAPTTPSGCWRRWGPRAH